MYQVVDNIVKYLFNYDDIYTEVTKRTSKLGQHRGTENLMHRLNQMSMTKDEDFIFEPQIRQASALVWEQMYPLAKMIENAYRFNLNTTTKIHRAIPSVASLVTLTANGTPTATPTSSTQYTLTANYNGAAVGQPDWTTYKVITKCAIQYDVSILQKPERRTAYSAETTISSNPSTLTFTSVIDIIVSTLVGNYTSSLESRVEFVNPTLYNVGDYVTFGNDVYKTIKATDENTDITNTEYFEKLTADDRDCIIFCVNKHHWLDENVFPIVDNAIFEVIVHYIMAKWFDTSAPEEAAIYDAKYKSDIVDLRHRIQSQNKPLRNKYKFY